MQDVRFLSVEGPDTFPADLCRQRDRGVKSSDAKTVITIRAPRSRKRPLRAARLREGVCREATRAFQLRRRGLSKSERPELTSAKLIVRRPRARLVRAIPRPDRSACRQAESRRVRVARGGGRGYAPNDYQSDRPARSSLLRYISRSAFPARSSNLAGMKDSQVIIAINKDEDAPIFQVADVAWWRSVQDVPADREALEAEGKRRRWRQRVDRIAPSTRSGSAALGRRCTAEQCIVRPSSGSARSDPRERVRHRDVSRSGAKSAIRSGARSRAGNNRKIGSTRQRQVERRAFAFALTGFVG